MADNNHYLALYRKYRPQTFDEVRGRDNVVRTLKNQIITGRIGHSYLFCGTRGTGKTTIAKIFARAVNCENVQDGNPCGVCPCCQSTLSDSNMNVVEMDAASNNGVEDVRNIIEEVSYSPTQGRYRVYIIDEVHMLSTAAFNALLKTLEEPPAYAVFILATTEPNKLPVTILSRCQRYDFGRLSSGTIAEQLQYVAGCEGLTVEERALRFIASAADGSLRDGLSLLDQCNAFNFGNEILTYEKTLEILGAVDSGIFSRLFRAIHDHRVKEALDILEEVLEQGRELMQFVTDFIGYLRNVMLLKASEEIRGSLDASAEDLDRMVEDARSAELPEILRYIRIFSALTEQIRYAANRRILTEVAMIRLCEPGMDISTDAQDQLSALQERVRVLEQQLLQAEKRIAEGAAGGYVLTAESSGGKTADMKTPAKKTVRLPEALPADLQNLVKNWSLILADLEPGLAKIGLQKARLSVNEENHLMIVTDNFIMLDRFQKDKEGCVSKLKNLIRSKLGKDVELEFRGLDRDTKFTDNYIDLQQINWDEIQLLED